MPEARIISNPDIMMGKPTVRGTRITVEHLLRLAARGLTISEIVQDHSHLTREDVSAAFAYAADLTRNTWLATQPEGTGAWQSDGPEWTTIECSN